MDDRNSFGFALMSRILTAASWNMRYANVHNMHTRKLSLDFLVDGRKIKTISARMMTVSISICTVNEQSLCVCVCIFCVPSNLSA